MGGFGFLFAFEVELEVHRGRVPAARSASSALSMATIGALSSLAERP